MSKIKFDVNDYIGMKSGKLIVIGLSERKETDRSNYLDCLCECGNTTRLLPYQISGEKVKSCGCVKIQSVKKMRENNNSPEDGRTKNKLYGRWKAMLRRCENPNSHRYYRYGARGIKVCDEWHDFWAFAKWVDSMGGIPKGYTIDRINNDGNYEPSNCRFASASEQAINKSSNVMIEFKGKIQTLKEWSNELNISWDVLDNRLLNGWNVEKALSTPVMTQFSKNRKF